MEITIIRTCGKQHGFWILVIEIKFLKSLPVEGLGDLEEAYDASVRCRVGAMGTLSPLKAKEKLESGSPLLSATR